MRGRGQRFPVIILTARDDLVVEGLDAGADDYVIKPFDVEELLARLRARVRCDATTRGVTRTTLQVGEMSLDRLTRRVNAGRGDVELDRSGSTPSPRRCSAIRATCSAGPSC